MVIKYVNRHIEQHIQHTRFFFMSIYFEYHKIIWKNNHGPVTPHVVLHVHTTCDERFWTQAAGVTWWIFIYNDTVLGFATKPYINQSFSNNLRFFSIVLVFDALVWNGVVLLCRCECSNHTRTLPKADQTSVLRLPWRGNGSNSKVCFSICDAAKHANCSSLKYFSNLHFRGQTSHLSVSRKSLAKKCLKNNLNEMSWFDHEDARNVH